MQNDARKPEEQEIGQSLDPVLPGELGGTNARFALLEGGRLSPVEQMLVASYPQFIDAVESFLAGLGRPAVAGAVIAVAGPVEGGRGALTNSPWVVDASELSAAFGFKSARVLNDFEATAWSLPQLTPADAVPIGGGAAVKGAPAVVLGPGTGLGIACYMPRSEGAIVIATEGGHATLPAMSAREDRVIDALRREFGHVSIER